jgi:hypothetical protein
MDKEPKTNTENENLREPGRGDGDNPGRNEFHRNDYTGDEGLNDDQANTGNDVKAERSEGIDDTDKYLAMEQPGITYTKDSNPANLSDTLDYDNDSARDGVWNEETEAGTYADAFSQDDYILRDNVDLDEDQNQSLSSDDEDFEETNERY